MSLERSPLDEAKPNMKLLKKLKCQKRQRLTHFFNITHKYIINELRRSGLSVPIFLSMRKNCKI